MNQTIRSAGIAIAGLTTSIITAALIAAIDHFTGFNVFGFSILVVIPVGAVCCGMVAASGYYFGAMFLHLRPTRILLLQMVVIAAFTQFLIYWLEYQSTYIDGVAVSSVVPFGKYLDVVISSMHLKVGRALQSDTGEVGSFGYWLAVIDFIGFLVGGLGLYGILLDQPSCGKCSKYLKTLVKKTDTFDDTEDLSAYYDEEYAHPVGSPEFAQHVGTKHSVAKVSKGAFQVETRVMMCPGCAGQFVSEKVTVHNGRDWSDVKGLKRLVAMPEGINVAALYR